MMRDRESIKLKPRESLSKYTDHTGLKNGDYLAMARFFHAKIINELLGTIFNNPTMRLCLDGLIPELIMSNHSPSVQIGVRFGQFNCPKLRSTMMLSPKY